MKFPEELDIYIKDHIKIIILIIFIIILTIFFFFKEEEEYDEEMILQNDYSVYTYLNSLPPDKQIKYKKYIFDIIHDKKTNTSTKAELISDFKKHFLTGALVGILTSEGLVATSISTLTYCIVHSCISIYN